MFFAFLRNTAISLMAYALTTLLSVGINVVVARMLGPAGQGAFILLVLFSAIVGLVINIGLGQSAIYYFRRGTDSLDAIVNHLAAMTFVIGIPTAVLLAIGVPWYGRSLLGNIPTELILAVVFLTPIVLGRMYAEYIFVALHDFVWYSGLNLIDLSVRLGLLLVLLGAGTGLQGAVIAVLLSTTLSTLIGWNVIRSRTGRVRPVVERTLLKRFASYGVRSYGAVFITYLNLRFDQFLVGFFLSLRDVGIYSVAVIVAELTMKLANVVSKVLFANVSSLDSKSATELTGRAIRATMTLAILTGGILVFVGPWLIRALFGPAFQSANPALFLLLPGTILFNLTQVLYSDLSGRGKPEVGLKASALSLVVTLVGNAALTPRWGINGAALTSTIAYALGASFILRHYLRTAHQKLSQVMWVTRDDLRVIARVLRRIFVAVRAQQAPGAYASVPPGIMSPRRTRIIFVLSQLVQHGSERYLFEICQALDKERFEVEVLTRKYFVKRHYYYAKLRALGIRVHTKLISRRHVRYPVKALYRKSALAQRLINRLHSALIVREYSRFFDSFDVVAVVGIETYCDALRPLLDANRNVVIHHVNHEFQFERNYFAECPQDKIVTLDAQQESEIRRSPLRDARVFRFPLSMSLSSRGQVQLPRLETDQPIRIGVVSRLFRDRPNEPMFRCFHALLQEMDAVLYFYGGGDKTQYDKLLEELGIQDKVRFMGHQEDLQIAIRRDGLALMWLVSMGPSISYGSIEVASLGMPMVFWNLSSMPYEEVLTETDNALHSFSDVDRFVTFNRKVLTDQSERAALGARLRSFVRGKFEIANYIKSLENYYQDVADRASANA